MTDRKLPASGSRLVWIDQLRAIAFLFVVMGHVAQPEEFQSWIYSFHMPLFFLISGLTVNRDKLRGTPVLHYLSKQFKGLMIPYFWMSFFCFVLWYYAFQILHPVSYGLEELFPGILFSNGILYGSTSNALWFLPTLMVANILYILFLKLCRGHEIPLILLVIACGVGGYLWRGVPVFWHVNVSLTAVVFLYLGDRFMALYRWLRLSTHQKTAGYIAAVCGVIVLSSVIATLSHILNGRISMTANKFGANGFLFYVTAVFYSLALALIVMHIPYMKVFSFIGQNTLLYVGLHLPILRILELWFPVFTSQRLYVSLPVTFGLYFFMVLVVLIVNRFFPYMNGKHTLGPATRGQLIARCLCVLWCLCVPAFMLFRGTFTTLPSRALLGLLTAAFSVGFVLLTSRFTPVIYLQDGSKSAVLQYHNSK